MPIVTKLETQKHNPERVNVYLDGEFGFGASAYVLMTRELRIGAELADADVEQLKQDDSVEKTYSAALNFLSFRPRSRREIQDYFRRRKIEPEIGQAVINRLLKIGMLDDREFARFWVDNRQTFRPRGTRALRTEMRQKGLGAEVIEEALADIGDEEETAYRAGQKKLRSFETLDEREFFRRMVGFLQRRGFPYDACSRAARRLWEERESTDAL